MSSGRLPIGHRCFILRVLDVVCMSSGRLPIGHRCFILRVLEVVCACLVGGSILDIVALYCECYCVVVGLFLILFFT